MHRIAGETVGPDSERELILVQHPPAKVLFISTADTDLALLERAWSHLESAPTAAFVQALPFRQPASADAYVREHVAQADIVLLRLLGGSNYYPHLIGALQNAKLDGGKFEILTLSAGSDIDETFHRLCTFDSPTHQRLNQLFSEGGPGNMHCAARWISRHVTDRPQKPSPVPDAIPVPQWGISSLAESIGTGPSENPTGVAWILFYRAFELSGDLEGISTMASALHRCGLHVTPFFAQTLRDSAARHFLLLHAEQRHPSVVICLHQFSLQGADDSTLFFHQLGVPVLQVGASRSPRDSWKPTRPPAAGLSPSEIATQCALPELDGRIFAGVPLFRELIQGSSQHHHPADVDRCAFIAKQAYRWSRLRNTPNHEKRIAILLSNYPVSEGRIGNGVGLDTPESAVRVLHALAASGYQTGPIPSSSAELMHHLLQGATNDHESIRYPEADQRIPKDVANRALTDLPAFIRADLAKHWNLEIEEDVPIAGRTFGNVFVGIQPPRGFEHQTSAVYHSPDIPPPPAYLLYYQCLKETFCADAVIHLGKHGNLEWLPGRATGLDETDYPQLALQELPNLYPFIVNDPGEGTQAKRRTHAVIIDHLTPPLMRAGLYGDLEKLETLLEEHARATSLYPQRAQEIETDILQFLSSSAIARDLPRGESSLANAESFLCEIKESRVRNGLHVLGEMPAAERLIDFISSALECGSSNRPGLTEAILGRPIDTDVPPEERDRAADIARAFVASCVVPCEGNGEQFPAHLVAFKEEIVQTWLPRLKQTPNEISHLLAGLSGRFIPPGPSGSPTRGRADTLPTGRNFYSIDPRVLPTPSAWRCGKLLAERLLERHFQDHGEPLQSAALVIWGTSNMRTGGDDIAQALWLWGCEPIWEDASGRLVDVQIVPASLLGRPRVDLTIRISGLFRDAFGETARLLATIPHRLSELPEPPDLNPIRENVRAARLRASDDPDRIRRATSRIFTSAQGSYGAGILQLMQSGEWSVRRDIADVFIRWGRNAIAPTGNLEEAEQELRERLTTTQAVIQNQDNRDHDILDSDDYFQFQGGMAAAVESSQGRDVPVYHGDSSRPETPVIRSLSEEVAKVLHSRVLNPRWIEGMKRHGYKGAFEMAATVDYLFGYAMTTHAVKSHHFDLVADAIVIKEQHFFREMNPAALKDCATRLLEAHERRLWSDPAPNLINALTEIILTEQLALE